MGHLLLVAAAVAAVTTPLAARQGVEAPELFWPSDVPSVDRAEDDPVVRRRGTLQANFESLHRLAPPGGEYNFRPISVGWIRLLAGTEWVKVSIDSRTETDYGVRLTGSLVDSYGILMLVVHDDIIAGQVRTMHDVFRINTDLRAREFIVTQLDPSQFAQDDLQPPADDAPSETRRNPPFPGDPSSASDGGSEIRVLVAYTSTLEARLGGLRGVQLLVDDDLFGSAETAFRGSDVDVELVFAGLIEVDYVKLGHPVDDLERLQNPSDAFLDDLYTERDRVDADLVHLIVDDRWIVLDQGRLRPVCGSAYTYTGLSSFSEYAFAVSGIHEGCDLTFVHEIGHLMGLGHDPANPRPQPALPNGRGYVSLEGGWRTIMALQNARCLEGEEEVCTVRQPFFSDPFATHVDGRRRGDSQSNAVQALNQIRADVASFR